MLLARRWFLGLDVSTRITGFALINPEGDLRECGVMSTKGAEEAFEKAEQVKSKLSDLVSVRHGLAPDDVVVGVEDYLKAFLGSTFKTKGMFSLAQMNTLVSYN